jgi:hypothetical protein
MLNTNQILAIEAAMEEEHRRDRDALQRLKRFLPTNGAGRTPGLIERPNGHAHEAPLFDEVTDNTAEPETIIDKVEQIMQSDITKRWTIPLMLAHLQEIKFPLAAKKPESTLGLVFVKLLRKRRSIRIVKRGGGRIPNVFKAVSPQERNNEQTLQNERAAS